MIGYFPSPYPDELFYSICARFSDRMKFPSDRAVKRELSMTTYAAAGVGLPRNLDALVSSLPPGCEYTSDRFIDEHTLLPLFAPFLSCDEYCSVRSSMKSGNDRSAHRAAGLICRSWNFGFQGVMRYCPACVKEDREQHGETFWHRLHQINGVDVCPKHFCLIESVKKGELPERCPYASAETCELRRELRPMDERNPYQVLAKDVAEDVIWLLKQRDIAHCPHLVELRFIDLLFDRVFYKRFLDCQEFLKNVRPALIAKFRREMASEVSGDRCILRRSSTLRPIETLMRIRLKGHTAESFFSGIKNLRYYAKTATKNDGGAVDINLGT